MPMYKVKEQIMRNPLFTFLKQHILQNICRYKQYIINIKIVKILITITAAAVMVVINNNINNNNYNCNKNKTKKTKKKLRRLPLKTSREFSKF